MVTINVTSAKEGRVYEITLNRIEAKMNEKMIIWTFSAIRTNDEAIQGYYLVEWLSEPYIV